MNKSDLTAVILCGGLSKRMKTPKHKLFLERVISRLEGFGKIALSVRDDSQITEFAGDNNFTLWPDLIKNCGPLGGIYTALKMSQAEFIFITPCDVPDITADFINELIANLDNSDLCLLPVVNGNVQPLTGIYASGCIKRIKEVLDGKNLSVKKFLEYIDVHYVNFDFSDEYKNVLRNINTPEEYKNWLNKLNPSLSA